MCGPMLARSVSLRHPLLDLLYREHRDGLFGRLRDREVRARRGDRCVRAIWNGEPWSRMPIVRCADKNIFSRKLPFFRFRSS